MFGMNMNDMIFSQVRKWIMNNVEAKDISVCSAEDNTYYVDVIDKINALLDQVKNLPPVKKELAKYSFDESAKFIATIPSDTDDETAFSYIIDDGKGNKADLNEVIRCKEINKFFKSLV